MFRHESNHIILTSLNTYRIKSYHSITVKDTPQLSDLKEPGTSKLDWRYFVYNKIDRNELQVRICIDANLELIPINFIMFKVPPAQF